MGWGQFRSDKDQVRTTAGIWAFNSSMAGCNPSIGVEERHAHSCRCVERADCRRGWVLIPSPACVSGAGVPKPPSQSRTIVEGPAYSSATF